MGKYTGIPCAACGRLFEEGDDIVVCPVCGAPHHRECYAKLGHGALEERHALGEAWQPPKGKQGDNPALVICNTCGAQTPADEPFCINCGQRLDLPPRQEQPSPGGSYYIPGVGPIHKNATIGDASMEELAMFVGPNAQFFLPRFQAIHQRKSSFSWNWSAFFLNIFYFFYRKMYLVGGVLMLVSMVTMIPSVVFTNEYMKLFLQSITGQVIPYNEELMIQMSSIQQYIRIGQMALSLTLGMFANKLYLNHAQKVIRKTKEEFGEGSPACLTGIATRGRTNMTMVLLVLCWMIFLYFAISFAITNNIISIL